MEILHETSALEGDRSQIIKSIYRYFITLSIFSHSKHNFKSEFHHALIKFTNLHLLKFLRTLNLMNFHKNKLKYEEVQFFLFLLCF
jgi:hypothetical protein